MLLGRKIMGYMARLRWLLIGVSMLAVIALSAFAGAENRVKTQQAGFEVHLDKPIDPPRLIETIQALVKAEAG